MIDNNFTAKQLHLVLVGGGHAQIAVLKSLGINPIKGLQITLITDVLLAPYSGMLPAHLEGLCSFDEMHIDLARLASFAGADLVTSPVTAIDGYKKIISIKDRPPIHYDILSINAGAVPSIDMIDGAEDNAIAVKPIAHFLEKLPAHIPDKSVINIIGAGVAGIEIAFALHTKFESQDIDIHIFSRSDTLLAKMPPKAGQIISKLALKRGIKIHYGVEITKITSSSLITDKGADYPSGLNLIVTGVKAAPFVASLSDGLNGQGFISVDTTLESPVFEGLFACGDIASIIGHAREKAGVFAVRAGAILVQNIRRAIYNQPLIRWKPQKHYLALIGTGDGKALAVRNGFVHYHQLWFHLKQKIDSDFMNKFNNLPEMKIPKPAMLPYYQKAGFDENDAIFKAMRCSGCAAKASASLLEEALQEARKQALLLGADEAFLPPAEGLHEDAGLTPALQYALRHSFDSLNEMIADPFIFAKIAVNHALSDLYVSGAEPVYAQAHITLAEASHARQLDKAIHILTGTLLGLSAASTKLIGGHTSQSTAPSLGFAVTGKQLFETAPYDEQSEYVIITTKKLGVGIGLAAYMRQKLSALAYNEICQEMLISNQKAASACFKAGAIAMTDITGFGLARHLMNLFNTLPPSVGCQISLSQLAYFAETEALLRQTIESSSFGQNKASANQLITAPSAAKDWRMNLLFDPQTSGGICAIVKADKADSLLEELSSYSARKIGHLRPGNKGLLVEI